MAVANRRHDFWQRALILVSRTHSLTQTHALFLEWHCIQATRKAGRYEDDNSNSGSKPHTPAPLEADCMEVFDTGRTLLATLGHPLFDPVAKAGDSQDEERFFCTGSGSSGRGIYTQEGFVVLKGSKARIENVPSLAGTPMETFRKRLFDSAILVIDGSKAVMTKDHLFQSPSYAAIALMGRNANGWTEWKTKDGKTLDAVKRQNQS